MNSALTLNHWMIQWVDIGIHTEACMTRPETCGAAGGAISLWVNVTDCAPGGGILSSLTDGTSGSLIFCQGTYLRYCQYMFLCRYHFVYLSGRFTKKTFYYH